MTDLDPGKITKDIPDDNTQADPKAAQPDEKSSNNNTIPTNANAAKSEVNSQTPTARQGLRQVTKPSGSSVESNLTASWLSYGALSDMAETIAQNLKKHLIDSDTLLVSAGDSILADLRQWSFVHATLNGAQTYCDSILNQYLNTESVQIESAGAIIQTGLETGTAILSALSGIFQLFKTTTTITQHQTELDHDAIVSAIAAQILILKPTVSIKSLRSIEMRPGISNEGPQALAKLMHSRSKAAVLADSQTNHPEKKVDLDGLIKLIDQIVDRTLLFNGGENAGSFINGERIHKALRDDRTLLLDLKPIVGGGDQINVKRTFIHTEELYVNGVAAVSYSLVDSKGTILTTGTIHGHTGYTRYDMVPKGIWETSAPSLSPSHN